MKKKNPAENLPEQAASKPAASNPAASNPAVSTTSSSKSATSKPAATTSGNPEPTGSADAATAKSGATPDGQKPARKKAVWPRLTVIVLFALLYAYDLFEAISDTFFVTAQITNYNAERVLNGLNTVAIPWVALILTLLVPIAVFFLALLFARKRNIGILALSLLAGLSVVAALSLSLTVLAGVLAG